MPTEDIYLGSCFDIKAGNLDSENWCNCSHAGEGHCMPHGDLVTCAPKCGANCDKTADYLQLATQVDCSITRPPVDPVIPDPVSDCADICLFIILIIHVTDNSLIFDTLLIQIQPHDEKITKEEATTHCTNVLSAIMKACQGLVADSVYQDTLAHCVIDVSVSTNIQRYPYL